MPLSEGDMTMMLPPATGQISLSWNLKCFTTMVVPKRITNNKILVVEFFNNLLAGRLKINTFFCLCSNALSIINIFFNIITKMFGFTSLYTRNQHTTRLFTFCDVEDGELQVVQLPNWTGDRLVINERIA